MDSSWSQWVADLLVWIHAGWVLFMVGGVVATAAGLYLRRLLSGRAWRLVHLSGMLLAALWSAAGRLCPLTELEYYLRDRVGAAHSDSGFVIRLLNRLIFPDLDASILAWVTGAAFLFVLGVIVAVPPEGGWIRRKSRPGATP